MGSGFTSHRPLSRRLDCCDRMIQNESRDPNGCNVYTITMQITCLTRKFQNGERNLHCDVVHITTVWGFNLTLDSNGVFAIKALVQIPELSVHCMPYLISLLDKHPVFLQLFPQVIRQWDGCISRCDCLFLIVTHKRIVNRMKMNIERNNLQLEFIRYNNKC